MFLDIKHVFSVNTQLVVATWTRIESQGRFDASGSVVYCPDIEHVHFDRTRRMVVDKSDGCHGDSGRVIQSRDHSSSTRAVTET